MDLRTSGSHSGGRRSSRSRSQKHGRTKVIWGGSPAAAHPHNVDGDLLNDLTDFDELGRAGFGVSFEFAAFRPMIGVVVMADMAEQKTWIRCGAG